MATTKDPAFGFTTHHINDDLFKSILHGIDPHAKLCTWKQSSIDTCNSILARFNSEDEEIQTFVGHICFQIQYKLPRDPEDEFHLTQVVLKAKPPGDETVNMISHVVRGLSEEFSQVFEKFKNKIGFSDTDHREIEMYRMTETAVWAIQPWVYHVLKDGDQKIFVYIMENFVSEGLTHLNTVDNVSVWSEEDIHDALRDISGMHAAFYDNTSAIPTHASEWLTPTNIVEIAPLLEAFLQHNMSLWKDSWPLELPKTLQRAIANINEVDALIDAAPKTLVHNDFNVRNSCLRPVAKNGKKRLVLYDWEVATIAPPQRDIVEFLAFILPPNADVSQWHQYVNRYLGFLKREIIKLHGGLPDSLYTSLQSDNFIKVFDMFIVEMLLNRLSLYGLGHTVHNFPFLEKVVQSVGSYLLQVKDFYPFLASGKQ